MAFAEQIGLLMCMHEGSVFHAEDADWGAAIPACTHSAAKFVKPRMSENCTKPRMDRNVRGVSSVGVWPSSERSHTVRSSTASDSMTEDSHEKRQTISKKTTGLGNNGDASCELREGAGGLQVRRGLSDKNKLKR
eukprot:1161187-Pelagomonas_calceolata.AAC.11